MMNNSDDDLYVAICMPVSGAGRLGDAWHPKYNPEALGIPKSDFKRKYNTTFIPYSILGRFIARLKRQTPPTILMKVDVVIRYNGNRDNILRLLEFDDTCVVELEPNHRAMFLPKSLRTSQKSLTDEFKKIKAHVEDLRLIDGNRGK